MADEVYGFFKDDVARIKAAVEFFETYGAGLRGNQRAKNFATADSVTPITGTLESAAPLGGGAYITLDFPINNQTRILIWCYWFSEKKGRKVACYYDPFLEIYIAFAKICVESTDGEGDPSPDGDGDPSPPEDPHLIDPGPPVNCPTNWCKYTWDGTFWTYSGSVGCFDLCPETIALPPPGETDSYYAYTCCPDISGNSPVNPPTDETAIDVPADFGVYDPAGLTAATIDPVPAKKEIKGIFDES